MSVRMPGLLDSELSEVARLRPRAANYAANADDVSQATLTIPEDGPAVHLRDWIALHDKTGLYGVYRVTNIAQALRRQIQLTLLHGIDILADSYWNGETEFSGTVTQFLDALLAQQTATVGGVVPWIRGTVEDNETTIKEKISYNRLSDLLPKAAPEGGAYQLEYDQSVFPWRINVRAKPATPACEFRLQRNVTSATITYNDADLCTRLILSNTSGGVSAVRVYNASVAAQNEWGIVTRIASIDTSDTLSAQVWPEAEAWVAKFFQQHAAPSVQIQIEGRELWRLTGDSWDHTKVGQVCRVALPDYGHTFEERVISVTCPDPYGDPDRVIVSLANALPQFSETVKLIEKTAASASRAASGAARKADEAKDELDELREEVVYQTAYEITDRQISAIASATGLQFNADGTPVTDANGNFVYSQEHPDNALIAQIQLQAGRYDRIIQATGISETPSQGEVSLATQISQTHQIISQEATATGLIWVEGDPTADPPTEGHYEVNPGAVSSSLYKQLANQITQSAQTVTDNITARGYVTAAGAKNAAWADIGAELKDSTTGVITSAKIKALVEGDTSLIQLVAQQVQIAAGDVTISGNIKLDSVITIENGVAKGTFGSLVITGGANLGSTNVYFNSVPLASFIKSISLTGPTNNEYTLTWENAGGNSTSKTFSRAASGVTVSWSGTTGTVTVNPQNQEFTITYPGPSSASVDSITITNSPLTGTLYTGTTGTRYAQATGNLTAWHNESDGEGGTTQTSLLNTSANVQVNIESILSAAENAIKVTGPTWATTPASGITGNSNTATFTTDAASPVSGAAKELTLYLSQDNGWSSNKKYVYAHHTNSGDGNRIARIEVDASTLVSNAEGAVTVGAPYCIDGAVAAGTTRTTIKMKAAASNGNVSTSEASLFLDASTFSVSGVSHRCINVNLGGVTIGRYDTQSIYNDGAASVTHNVSASLVSGTSGNTAESSLGTIAAGSTMYVLVSCSGGGSAKYYPVTAGSGSGGYGTFNGFIDNDHSISDNEYVPYTGGTISSTKTIYAVIENSSGNLVKGPSITVSPPSSSHTVSTTFVNASGIPEGATVQDANTLSPNTQYCIRASCGGSYAYHKFKTPATAEAHTNNTTLYETTSSVYVYYMGGYVPYSSVYQDRAVYYTTAFTGNKKVYW